MNDEQVVGQVARLAADKVVREQSYTTRQPGTVIHVAIADDVSPPIVVVHLDGDPETSTHIIPTLTGVDLFPGTRVMVQFTPPQGAEIIGTIGRVVRPMLSTSNECDDPYITTALSNGTPVELFMCCEEFHVGYFPWTPGTAITIPASGIWSLSATFEYKPAATPSVPTAWNAQVLAKAMVDDYVIAADLQSQWAASFHLERAAVPLAEGEVLKFWIVNGLPNLTLLDRGIARVNLAFLQAGPTERLTCGVYEPDPEL